MSTVQEAAISYFGLPEGTTLVEGGPVGAFAFIIPLTEEHLRGIADRMKAMAEANSPVPIVSTPHVWLHKAQVSRGNERLAEHNGNVAISWDSLTEHQQRGRRPIPGAQVFTAPTQEQLRAEWEKMDGAARGRFGSFGRYAAQSAMGMAADDAIEPTEGAGGRKVQHVDAPHEEQSGLPDAVWILSDDANMAQKMYASDTKPGELLVAWHMLTEYQKAKYVKGGV